MSFRYSQLNSAHFCLTKYKLQYLDKVVSPEIEPSHFIFGTAFHYALEQFFKEGADPVETFKAYWQAIDPNNYSWQGRDTYASLANTGEILLSKWLRLHSKNYKALYVELPLTFKVGGFDMTGRLDWLGYYKDVLSLVDWKTSGYDFDKNKGIVDGQTWLYVEAVKQQLKLDVKQVVYAPFVKYEAKVQTPICLPVTEKKLTSMTQNAIMVMRDLSSRSEWPRNEQSCLKCNYFKHCYAGETK